jgi:hypothetical protein
MTRKQKKKEKGSTPNHGPKDERGTVCELA